MGYKIAVVGATGNVGREMLNILAEREFPADEVFAVASERSVGMEVSFGDDEVLKVHNLDTFDFSTCHIALFSPGASISKVYAPKAGQAGCVVIDNTSEFRMDPNVPLIIPEVNPEAMAGYTKRNIIANPNCSTIQMLMTLKPLHEAFGIKRVVVSTYQSVSGGGRDAMDELFNQTRDIYMNNPVAKTQNKFTKQIAFNVIPHIDTFMDDGATKEEWKMQVETMKILDSDIRVHANCCRVPVFNGHAEYINIETEEPMTVAKVRSLMKAAPGVSVVDIRENEGYVTPSEASGEDLVYVSRVRKDSTVENGMSFWCVGDNLRKGAALNTVQIAELLVRDYLK